MKTSFDSIAFCHGLCERKERERERESYINVFEYKYIPSS